MKGLVLGLVFCLALTGSIRPDSTPAATFYLQLIRGTDSDTPPQADARPIGPKLSSRLHAVLKWKRYWELKRDSLTLKPGEQLRKRMSPEREVEITRLNADKIKVRIFRRGKLTRSEQHFVHTPFHILGGDRGQHECWFIVVRRDPPPAPEKE